MTEKMVSDLSSQQRLDKDIAASMNAPKFGRARLLLLPFLPFLTFLTGCASQVTATVYVEDTPTPVIAPTITPTLTPVSSVDCNFGPEGKGWKAPDGYYYGFRVGGNVSSNMVICPDQETPTK